MLTNVVREGGVVQRLGKSSVEGEADGTISEFQEDQRLAGCAGRAPPPPRCTPAIAMAEVSERTLQLSVLVAFASGVLLGWQANRLRRRYLDWRKRRLQDKLAATQKKLDLA
uniref:Mitoregulin n=1 Tax=Rhinopithecus bieti TaxID=61621 RepID=A0A2K6KUU9_RHIBE